MCEFKIWLTSKYYSKNIDAPDYNYWCERMAQAYNDGELSAASTILDDYNEGLIELSPSDAIIINAFVDAK